MILKAGSRLRPGCCRRSSHSQGISDNDALCEELAGLSMGKSTGSTTHQHM